MQRAAWQDLPPLRPTVTATRPVAPLDAFTGSLATAHNPSFLAPLGHVVDPAGPSGHVAGLASPVLPQVMSGGPELTIAPRKSPAAAVVQRVLGPWIRPSDPEPPTRAAEPTFAANSTAPVRASAPAVQRVTVDEPARQLSTSSSLPSGFSFTSAPDQGPVGTLPVVATASAPAGTAAPSGPVPTVARHATGEGHDEESEVQRVAAVDPDPVASPAEVAPLLGLSAQDGVPPSPGQASPGQAPSGQPTPGGGGELMGPASATTAPGRDAPAVQRSVTT
ncbi:MAG TPA: hypothetical protein VII33_03665, partial [Nakamurella sp.]